MPPMTSLGNATARLFSSSSPSFKLDLDAETDEGFIGEQSSPTSRFRLHPRFVQQYADRRVDWGFGGLSEFVFRSRYSRLLPDGSKESWAQTCERVVNGTYNMQKRWINSHDLGWDSRRAQKSAREMFDRMFSFKFLPPGRGLWAQGSPLTEERHLFAALNNCAFVSTENLMADPAKPFCFLMDASLLGVGTGFDCKGAGTITAKGLKAVAGSSSTGPAFAVLDSREGWVASVRALLEAHFLGHARPHFDYSGIRPRGAPIKGFGGSASGPEVLQELHASIDACLTPLAGKKITTTAIVDLMNLIGRAVVAGQRQTAEIAFGSSDDEEFLDLKDYSKNPQRAGFGWCSNNSVFAEAGKTDYEAIAKRIRINGEPGLAWLDNMRAYSRMCDPPDNKDHRAAGGNPCLEQTLEPYELCCLVETFPNRHDSYEDFQRTLKFAFLYAKTVTLGKTTWPETNRVMLRNRRIGCSMSGIAQFIASKGLHALKDWSEQGYRYVEQLDRKYSDWLAIPTSIKRTSIKPSGTVSLLAGASPGIHFPESRFYIRRVRVSANHEVVEPLRRAGYSIEPALEDPERKVVVSFPVDVGEGVRTLSDVSMWEQLSIAAFLQRYWADNQVSATITFDPETEGKDIARALEVYQYQLKGVSFLPRAPKAAYPQLPYEAISEDEYRKLTASLKHSTDGALGDNSEGSQAAEETAPERFCDSDVCELPLVKAAANAPETVGKDGALISSKTKPTK